MEKALILKVIADKVKEKRIEKGYSQQELALEADIPKNQVGRIERGEINTSIITLFKISQALEVQLKDLIEF